MSEKFNRGELVRVIDTGWEGVVSRQRPPEQNNLVYVDIPKTGEVVVVLPERLERVPEPPSPGWWPPRPGDIVSVPDSPGWLPQAAPSGTLVLVARAEGVWEGIVQFNWSGTTTPVTGSVKSIELARPYQFTLISRDGEAVAPCPACGNVLPLSKVAKHATGDCAQRSQ